MKITFPLSMLWNSTATLRFHKFLKRHVRTSLTMFLSSFFTMGSILAQPTFTQVFTPDEIGPGSASLLTFTIDNTQSGAPVTDLAFSNTLPASVTLATPAIAQSTCGDEFTLTAMDGGSTISFSGGEVGGGATCTISVYITSSTPGMHTNLTGDLTSSAGNSGTSTDDLIVSTTLPGFSKSFNPTTVELGECVTLTFTIDNTANANDIPNLDFTDILPDGLVIASPSNATTDCGIPTLPPTITAIPGTSLISLDADGIFFPPTPVLTAGSSCQVTVDLIAEATSTLNNISDNLLADFVNSGLAIDAIEVTRGDPLHISKQWLNDPVGPGSVVDLEVTITNFDRDFSATNVSFTDDLDDLLTGLAPSGALPSDPCGVGSMLSFSGGVLTLSGGTLAADGGSCTFVVTCLVPAGSMAGTYANATSAVIGDVGGMVSGNMADAKLFVAPVPVFTKTFLTDPVEAGGSTTMEFTITNTSSTFAASDISFIDNLTQFLDGVNVEALPMPGFCGAGSLATVTEVSGEEVLSIFGANLPASGSCTFSIDLGIPPNTPSGPYTNTTSTLTATIDGETVVGMPASDDLTVVGLPSLTKVFTDDPVNAGETVTLEFTISYDDEGATGDATNISFTDDLNAALAGLVAVGLPMNDICGTGSMITGTDILTFSGGSLSPGETCTFSITLQVPGGALPGTYTNTTSDLSATVGGLMGTNVPASDDLLIGGLEFTKEFIDDPALPGETKTLRFTINNTTTQDATGIVFTDALNAALPGLSAQAPLPTDPCGAGSSITGTTFLIFSGGNVLANTSCFFDVTVLVPPGAADGTYGNTTSNLLATIGGNQVIIPPATDALEVNSELLLFTKEFTDDPVMPGGTTTLEFTIENLDPTRTITDIAFTDDLDATLSGLEATGLPMNDVCGAGSQISGTDLISFSGGSLAGGMSCTFSVTVQVPIDAPTGSFENTTSTITGMINTSPVNGQPASDDLIVEVIPSVEFTKSFDGPATAGQTTMVTFSLTNLDPMNSISDLSFSDDFHAMLTDASIVTLPSDVSMCGAGAQVGMIGDSILTFTGGELAGGAMCSFIVEVQLPCDAAGGIYPNITSDLTSNGLAVSPPDTADLMLSPAPPATFTRPPDTTIYLDANCMFDRSVANTGDVTDEMHTCCMDPLEATFTDSDMLNGCSGTGTIERSWSVTDCNGVMSPVQIQTITVLDTTKPTITCPPDPGPIDLPDDFNPAMVPANMPQHPSLDPSIYGMATGTDNCPNPMINYQDKAIGPTPANCPVLWVVERTWVITDACGLADTCVQSFPLSLEQIVLGEITGPITICPRLQKLAYSVPPLEDPTVYTWSFSDGSATIENNGSNEVLISFDETFSGGTLSVLSTNACGGVPSTLELVMGDSALCDLAGCMSEVEELIVDNTLLNAMGALDVYQNYNKIQSDAVINAMRDIIFKAGNEIVLNPPFTVELGATFIAEIEQCLEELAPPD